MKRMKPIEVATMIKISTKVVVTVCWYGTLTSAVYLSFTAAEFQSRGTMCWVPVTGGIKFVLTHDLTESQGDECWHGCAGTVRSEAAGCLRGERHGTGES